MLVTVGAAIVEDGVVEKLPGSVLVPVVVVIEPVK